MNILTKIKTKILNLFRKDFAYCDESRGFVIRLLIFFGLYAMISIYHGQLTVFLHKYHFAIADFYLPYLIFPLFLIFIFFRWKEIKSTGPYKNSVKETIIFILLSAVIFCFPINKIISADANSVSLWQNTKIFSIFYLQLLLGFTTLFAAVFNLKFIRRFKSGLFVILLAIILYMSGQILIENFWSYFSYTATFTLSKILPLYTDTSYIDLETFHIQVKDFNVFIGPPCTGIYSILTFIFLYLFTLSMIAGLRKIDGFKAFLALLAGIAATFFLNIIRITTIIMVGAYHSKELAINLFHEYLSAIFLLGLFILYLYFVIPAVLKK